MLFSWQIRWKVVACFILILIGPLATAQEVYVLESAYPVHNLQPQLQVVADTNDVFTPVGILKDSTLRFTPGNELPRRLEVGLTYWATFQMIIKDSIDRLLSCIRHYSFPSTIKLLSC